MKSKVKAVCPTKNSQAFFYENMPLILKAILFLNLTYDSALKTHNINLRLVSFRNTQIFIYLFIMYFKPPHASIDVI